MMLEIADDEPSEKTTPRKSETPLNAADCEPGT
jgi:hypothetical protein